MGRCESLPRGRDPGAQCEGHCGAPQAWRMGGLCWKGAGEIVVRAVLGGLLLCDLEIRPRPHQELQVLSPSATDCLPALGPITPSCWDHAEGRLVRPLAHGCGPVGSTSWLPKRIHLVNTTICRLPASVSLACSGSGPGAALSITKVSLNEEEKPIAPPPPPPPSLLLRGLGAPSSAPLATGGCSTSLWPPLPPHPHL